MVRIKEAKEMCLHRFARSALKSVELQQYLLIRFKLPSLRLQVAAAWPAHQRLGLGLVKDFFKFKASWHLMFRMPVQHRPTMTGPGPRPTGPRARGRLIGNLNRRCDSGWQARA